MTHDCGDEIKRAVDRVYQGRDPEAGFVTVMNGGKERDGLVVVWCPKCGSLARSLHVMANTHVMKPQ
jgi:hypothetical protein